MPYSVKELQLESNKQIKINFEGGDLSSDAGLLLVKEFCEKIGLEPILKLFFKTNDTSLFRYHLDDENLRQKLYQIIAGYFSDDDSDELTTDPVMKAVLNKSFLASQPTMSRFTGRLDEDTMRQFERVNTLLRKKIYQIRRPEFVLLDLDSTLLNTYGKQEGEGFNYHYDAHGYHPLLCYDGITGDLLKIELRNGTDYSSTGVEKFLQPLLDEYLTAYPDIKLFLRGDSGFATPGLYTQAETNGCTYAIRLKINQSLLGLASFLTDELDLATVKNKVDYAVRYGEFMYKAAAWPYPRRVVCKVEKPQNQLTYLYTFVVTNLDLPAEQAVDFYCNRGKMENFIKESKNGFDFSSVCSRSKMVNANRLQIHALAYNIFNWFRRLVLPKTMRKLRVDTIRLKLMKIAAKAVYKARYLIFRLCSSCPYKTEFFETLQNIRNLTAKLE